MILPKFAIAAAALAALAAVTGPAEAIEHVRVSEGRIAADNTLSRKSGRKVAAVVTGIPIRKFVVNGGEHLGKGLIAVDERLQSICRRQRPRDNASDDARDAYVEGCRRNLTMYPDALEAFDRAIASDPGFALAHAARAHTLPARACCRRGLPRFPSILYWKSARLGLDSNAKPI